MIEWIAAVVPASAQTMAAETMEATAQSVFQRQGPALFLAMAGFLLIFRRRAHHVRHSVAGSTPRASVFRLALPRYGQGKQPPSSN